MRNKSGRRLVMFDIDGTLTETMQVDTECFLCAFEEVFGFKGIDADWSRYRHTTDSGILGELFERRKKRAPLAEEIEEFRSRFLRLLAEAEASGPFQAIAGAAALLERLAASSRTQVALATGCWRDSARLKMASAGMRFDDFPSGTADDGITREEIMTISRRRAERISPGELADWIYVGDALWDARACRNLGIPFIGVGSGERGQRLAREGAVRVFPDLSETELFLTALEETVRG
jgi:phosphoglycolate phosphatase-like HAD superfamily hydrolase